MFAGGQWRAQLVEHIIDDACIYSYKVIHLLVGIRKMGHLTLYLHAHPKAGMVWQVVVY